MSSSLETIACTDGLWTEFASYLDPISSYTLSHTSSCFRRRFRDEVTRALYDIIGLRGSERWEIIKDVEAGGAQSLLYKALAVIPVSVIRERMFQYYLTMATDAVDRGDVVMFGDFRHYGTLCLLPDELRIGRVLALRSKASFVFMMKHTTAHTFPAGDRGDKIRNRLLSTFFIGCFVCSEESVRVVSRMMTTIKRCFYHDCYLAAYPLSEHVRHHEPLNYLNDAFQNRETRVKSFNSPSAEQLMKNSLLRRIPSIVIKQIGRVHQVCFSEQLIGQVSSFDTILAVLKKRASVPTGVYLNNFLVSALAAKLPWTPAAMVDLVRVYAEMPRTYYSRAHEDTWLNCLFCYLVECTSFIPIASVVTVFNDVVAINRRTDLFDLHFDCTPDGITRLRGVFIFTILYSIEVNYSLDTVLLRRCRRGEFVTWEKEAVWHLAKSLPEFRRFMQNSFSERFRVAVMEKNTDALATLVPFYSHVCEELDVFSAAVPSRHSGFNYVKYHSKEYIPGVASALVERPDWKELGLTSVLAGNSGRKTVRNLMASLHRYLGPAYDIKFGTPSRRRALYDLDHGDDNTRAFKRVRMH